ncbi:hypothetical protein [Streptomyces hydrogenans]|uniref:Uncharacterized protein n=1 Tax=Streptomyces hydrogenans TaxID=1873719 RepID=A0ABQ3PJH2_9ACTN|nr:hypothetical protein [Streptomyces hydrogenans]GHG10288.1 hypothetical protein GCM10018784_23780 [Streptomyces hydrogenans]GHI25171.1 hypothetical protein Shyd_65420 [Streptomyces hydrogenans]
MRVLFCGGPADGQWKDIVNPSITSPGNSRGAGRYVEVVTPPTPRDFADGTGTLTKVRYRLWRITLLGYVLDVAAPEADHNESDSVLYAVLRRDVADHLRGRS